MTLPASCLLTTLAIATLVAATVAQTSPQCGTVATCGLCVAANRDAPACAWCNATASCVALVPADGGLTGEGCLGRFFIFRSECEGASVLDDASRDPNDSWLLAYLDLAWWVHVLYGMTIFVLCCCCVAACLWRRHEAAVEAAREEERAALRDKQKEAVRGMLATAGTAADVRARAKAEAEAEQRAKETPVATAARPAPSTAVLSPSVHSQKASPERSRAKSPATSVDVDDIDIAIRALETMTLKREDSASLARDMLNDSASALSVDDMGASSASPRRSHKTPLLKRAVSRASVAAGDAGDDDDDDLAYLLGLELAPVPSTPARHDPYSYSYSHSSLSSSGSTSSAASSSPSALDDTASASDEI